MKIAAGLAFARRASFRCLLGTLPLLAGCPLASCLGNPEDDLGTPDSALQADLANREMEAALRDLTVADRAISGAADGDRGATDLPAADRSVPITTPDLFAPDLAVPDLAASPDITIVDLAPAVDLARIEDIAAPPTYDLANVDLATQGCHGFAAPKTVPLGLTPAGLAVADFDGDGRPDVAAAAGAQFNDSVAVLLGDGKGGFQPKPQVSQLQMNYDGILAAGDFNGDGRPDLVITVDGGPAVAIVLLNRGNALFDLQPARMKLIASSAASIAVGDFNEDGRLDFAVVSYDPHLVGTVGTSVFLGKGDGSFLPAIELEVDRNMAQAEGNVVAGDFDNDGHVDLLTGYLFCDHIGCWMEGYVLWFGVGNGTFLDRPWPYWPLPAPASGPTGPVGDFNRDGILDLVGEGMTPLLGVGDGSFVPSGTFPLGGNGGWGQKVEDVNHDGKLDFLTTDLFHDQWIVLLGDGNGTFDGPIRCPTGHQPDDIAVGDFNGDGKNDVVVANSGDTNVTLFLQQ